MRITLIAVNLLGLINFVHGGLGGEIQIEETYDISPEPKLRGNKNLKLMNKNVITMVYISCQIVHHLNI